MSTHLIYNRIKVQDIGVRVVSYLEAEGPPGMAAVPLPPGQFPPIVNPGVPSFYYPAKTRPHYGAPNEFQAMLNAADPRKQDVVKVVLHHDGMSTSQGCFMVLKQRELSTHLMINYDGLVYQPLDLMHVAWHAAGGVNGSSVGIDLCNPIKPERCQAPDNEIRRGYFNGTINGGTVHSLGYTDQQYESLIAVLRGLKEVFPNFELNAPIDDSGRVARNRLADPVKFKGITAHWHILADKWDPGPGFDWERVLMGVRGSQLWYPITLPGTRNLAQTPKEKALEAAEPYYRNTEDGDGGYFPIGVNQAWHAGIHLDTPRGTPVFCPADGSIVAARNTDPDERIGSPNFVLVKHDLTVAEGQKKTVFSLLMHLKKQAVTDNAEIPWIKRLVSRGMGDDLLPEDADTSAPGLKGFANERVALLDVEVKAGELLGHSDQFSSDILGGGELQHILDFAMFAGQALTQKGAGAFEIVDDDQDQDILCNARPIWKRIVRKPEDLRGLVEGSYPLSPSDVREFYNDARLPVSMRWIAARHPLEWSDKTEYDQLFGGGVDFEWSARRQARRFLAKIRKFLWWDDALTEHTGLPKDRMVYCYHPITLLAWTALGVARNALRPGADGVQKVLTGKELSKARAEDAASEAAQGSSLTNCSLTVGDDLQRGEDTDKPQTEDHEHEGWMIWEQGEWDPE